MATIGFDIGGSKIELQRFDAQWQCVARQRRETPRDYASLLQVVAEMLAEMEAPDEVLPIGVSIAGIIDPQSGRLRAANLAADGTCFGADISALLGRPVFLINDCRALAVSEAHLGAGRGAPRMLAVVMGTGIGGALIRDGWPEEGSSGVAGELGHSALPASVVQHHKLRLLRCGCGRVGCYETLLAGPGFAGIYQRLSGREATPAEIMARRFVDETAQRAWEIWLELAGEFLVTAQLALDPDCVVIGGGLSQIEGLAEALTEAFAKAHLEGLPRAEIRVASGGDATGARGAALGAVLAAHGGSWGEFHFEAQG